ncbi:3-hydroxymyristoyl/3-hydroxydecanoyl-(acyl carrier protein) dehydratase [Ewingella americana]|jgi:3-hydroxymyristoyl/3-hydroxydecanoyl-(acyl carrier protein) dehydratase
MMMPEVLHSQRDAHVLTLTLRLQPELLWFEGHFPELSILPGVAQLNWVMAFASRDFPQMGTFGGMDVLKFQKPLFPNEQVELRIEWLKEKQRLVFSYQAAQQVASSGKVILCP